MAEPFFRSCLTSRYFLCTFSSEIQKANCQIANSTQKWKVHLLSRCGRSNCKVEPVFLLHVWSPSKDRKNMSKHLNSKAGKFSLPKWIKVWECISNCKQMAQKHKTTSWLTRDYRRELRNMDWALRHIYQLTIIRVEGTRTNMNTAFHYSQQCK